MRKLLFLLPICLLWLACETSPENSEGELNDILDSLAMDEGESLSMEEEVLMACLSEPKQICQIGMWFATIGDPIANLPLDDLDPREIADSLETENGFAWISRVVYLDGGEILIEGEFLDETKATETDLNDSRVNRITIRNRNYYTTEGLKVGDPVNKVIETFGMGELEVAVIPEYETVVIPNPTESHIIFHFSDPGNKVSAGKEESMTISDVPGSWQIREIVVL